MARSRRPPDEPPPDDSHRQQKQRRTKSPATLYGYGIRTPAVVEARNAYMRSYMRRNKARRARYMQTYREGKMAKAALDQAVTEARREETADLRALGIILTEEYRASQAAAVEAGKLSDYGHGYQCGYREGLRRALTLVRGEPVND